MRPRTCCLSACSLRVHRGCSCWLFLPEVCCRSKGRMDHLPCPVPSTCKEPQRVSGSDLQTVPFEGARLPEIRPDHAPHHRGASAGTSTSSRPATYWLLPPEPFFQPSGRRFRVHEPDDGVYPSPVKSTISNMPSPYDDPSSVFSSFDGNSPGIGFRHA